MQDDFNLTHSMMMISNGVRMWRWKERSVSISTDMRSCMHERMTHLHGCIAGVRADLACTEVAASAPCIEPAHGLGVSHAGTSLHPSTRLAPDLEGDEDGDGRVAGPPWDAPQGVVGVAGVQADRAGKGEQLDEAVQVDGAELAGVVKVAPLLLCAVAGRLRGTRRGALGSATVLAQPLVHNRQLQGLSAAVGRGVWVCARGASIA